MASGKQETFGVKTNFSEDVKQVLHGNPYQQDADLIRETKENIYKSTQTMALGKGVNRNYNFPTTVTQPGFHFGIATLGSWLIR
jgi:hypothetical protein